MELSFLEVDMCISVRRGDEMKIVEQIFQSPDGKLYAFDKAKDENYKLIAQ